MLGRKIHTHDIKGETYLHISYMLHDYSVKRAEFVLKLIISI